MRPVTPHYNHSHEAILGHTQHHWSLQLVPVGPSGGLRIRPVSCYGPFPRLAEGERKAVLLGC